MVINKIRLINFHNFRDVEFTFKKRFTVLAGENATGKTAILDGLAVAIGGYLSGIKDIDSRNIRSDEVRLEQFNNAGIINIEPQYSSEVQCEAIVCEEEYNWTRTLNSKKGKTTRKDAKQIIKYAEDLEKKARTGKEVILPVFVYHGTGRLWAQVNDSDDELFETGSRFLGYKNCLNPISNEKLFLKWFKKMTLISLQDKKEFPQFNAVKNSIEIFLQDINENHKDEYITGKHKTKVEYNINSDELIITLEDGKELPFRYLSDGYRNVIGMVADIAFRMAVLNPNLEDQVINDTPGIVLIDEIDLYLHPKWQRKIVDDFKRVFPKIQFIGTTHSPFIIQSLKDGELQLLDDVIDYNYYKKYEDMSIEDVTENLMGVELPQWSTRKQKMYEASEEYFKLLTQLGDENSDKVKEAKDKLDILKKPFEDNVAFVAFLEQKRILAEEKLKKERA